MGGNVGMYARRLPDERRARLMPSGHCSLIQERE